MSQGKAVAKGMSRLGKWDVPGQRGAKRDVQIRQNGMSQAEGWQRGCPEQARRLSERGVPHGGPQRQEWDLREQVADMEAREVSKLRWPEGQRVPMVAEVVQELVPHDVNVTLDVKLPVRDPASLDGGLTE
jgi:hypothetical protein